MNRILCSTGSLIGKPNNRDYRLLKPLSEKLNCDGFEFMMYSSWYDTVDEMVKQLIDMNLSFPTMHCEKHIGQAISAGGSENNSEALRLFRINCDIAQRIHAEKLVIHLWDGEISDSHFQNNLNLFGSLSQIASSYGIDLMVENVVCNREDPMKHWCELAEVYPDIHFVYDTKMASFHQQMDLLYQDKYDWLWKNEHIRHYHINDYAGGYMDWSNLKTLPIGKGHIDFDTFFSFIKKINYEGTYTVEATAFDANGIVDTQMLNECFDRIREYL